MTNVPLKVLLLLGCPSKLISLCLPILFTSNYPYPFKKPNSRRILKNAYVSVLLHSVATSSNIPSTWARQWLYTSAETVILQAQLNETNTLLRREIFSIRPSIHPPWCSLTAYQMCCNCSPLFSSARCSGF